MKKTALGAFIMSIICGLANLGLTFKYHRKSLEEFKPWWQKLIVVLCLVVFWLPLAIIGLFINYYE